MWWKHSLAALLGICIEVAATIWLTSYLIRTMSEVRADYVRLSWPSTGKNWPEFANWLRHGGRKLTLDGAVTAAKDGLSEEVRAIFGPKTWLLPAPLSSQTWVQHIELIAEELISTRLARSLKQVEQDNNRDFCYRF